MLPSRIFVTGVPGSKWSSITHEFEKISGTNHSDQRADRVYEPRHVAGYREGRWSTGAMHRGSYFGPGMEFEAMLDPHYLDQAWSEPGGCRIVKSHEWSLMLDDVARVFPQDWIMLIYRPNEVSHWWWCEHGGFDITYARYHAYQDHNQMAWAIARQNEAMLKWANARDLSWHAFSEQWVEREFGQKITMRPRQQWEDILVTMYKPQVDAK